MKVQRLITLDVELSKRLHEENNASGLINSLLMNHYELKGKEGMTRDERKAYLLKKRDRLRLEKKHAKELEALQ